MTTSYSMQENEKVTITLKGVSREGLQFVQTLSDVEQEKCKTSMVLQCDERNI